ncbi:MAG: hypothetical protein JNK72_21605 [Myxococcales bacterium]|nr:hypothetical protein [Myxococcales bacterium]
MPLSTSAIGCLAWLALAPSACTRPDPWADCRAFDEPRFTSTALPCTDAQCRACVSAMSEVWRNRRDPAQAARFRVQFLRVGASPRDAFATKERPDGRYPIDHCAVGLARGARCAALSPYCVSVVAERLRDPELALGDRAQLERAATESCPGPRAQIIDTLEHCHAFGGDTRCASSACLGCVVSHLAALTVLGPLASDDPGREAFAAMVAQTPEPVARAIVERLGGPETPADLEPVVVQRGLRYHCFQLVGHSATPPPYGCGAVMTRFLTHSEYPDAPQAWEALRLARPDVRARSLDPFLLSLAGGSALAAPLDQSLRALSPEGTDDALRQAMARPNVTPAMYAAFRAILVAHGAQGADLPPEAPSALPPAGAGSQPSPLPPPSQRTPGAPGLAG